MDDEGRIEQTKEDAQAFLYELEAQGDSVAFFREEFQKLHQTLLESHENEISLNDHAAELTRNLEQNKRSRAEAEQEQADLEAAQLQLKDDLKKMLAQIARTKASAKEKQKQIEALQQVNQQMQSEIDLGSDWREDQLQQRGDLEQERVKLESYLDQSRTNLQRSREELQNLRSHLQRTEDKKAEVDNEVNELTSKIESKRQEARQGMQVKAARDQHLQELQQKVRDIEQQLQDKRKLADQKREEADATTQSMMEAKRELDGFKLTYEKLHSDAVRMREELEFANLQNEKLASELNELEIQIKEKRNELGRVEARKKRVQQLLNLTFKKIKEAEKLQATAEEEQAVARTKALDLTKEAEAQRRKNHAENQVCDDLKRERDVLVRSASTQEEKIAKLKHIIDLHKATCRNLENEIASYRNAVRSLRDSIYSLQQDLASKTNDLENVTETYNDAIENLRLQDLKAATLQRKINDQGAKLKQQQAMFDTVKADRNMYSKQLFEAQSAIDEMKRQFKTLNFQIEQLKDEITSKDHALVKEHFDHHKVEKEKEALSNELARIQKQIHSSEHMLSNQDVESVKLNRVIHEADEEKQRQEKEYRAIVSERDVLRNQLVQRDEELGHLYEKLKVQKSTLARGAAQYSARENEIAQKKQRLKELIGELEMSKAQVSNLPELEKEVTRLEAELLAERTKARRLEDELGRPLNVHRWRQLEVSDPERFALIQKVSSLQKRLMDAQNELRVKEDEIADKEKSYVKLKEILVRQPGSQVKQQIATYQETLKKKNKQYKSMVAELENYRHLVDELNREIKGATDKIDRLNKEYVRNLFRAQRGNDSKMADASPTDDISAVWADYAAEYGIQDTHENTITDDEIEKLLAEPTSPQQELTTETATLNNDSKE